MSQLAFSPEVEGTISRVVNSFYNRNCLKRHVNNTKEDLLAEARIAALIAVRRFDESKNVLLKAYVYKCVVNRLKDLNKQAYAKRRASYEPWDKELIEQASIGASDERLDSTALDLDARKVLTKNEYKVFSMILAGYNLQEIREAFWRKKNITKVRAQEIVKECFSHIWQKLTLKEMSQASMSLKSPKSYCVAMPC